MEKLINSFEQHFKVKLQNPLKSPRKIQVKELLTKYILYKDTSRNTVLDFLIFDTTNGFPPLHKRINSEGVIQSLENFQFSIMFATEVEGRREKFKMEMFNKQIAHIIIEKGLANVSEDWIQKYL